MREILFRGKTTGAAGYEENEWVYGNLINMDPCPGGYCEINTVIMPPTTYIAHGDIWGDFWFVYPETTGQFTGYQDKHGRMVFEGDIVKTKYGRLCIVKWFSSPSSGEWDMTPISTAKNIFETSPPDIYDLFASANLEIVGNIHDNPELMEAQL